MLIKPIVFFLRSCCRPRRWILKGRGRYAGSNPARLWVMAERKGQVFVDERAIIVQLRWVWGASEQEAGEHFTCKLAPVERIRRLFSNL